MVSCQKENPDENNSSALYKIKNPDFINCFYKTNSYWVYKDSLTNNLDSVYITNSYHGEVYDPTFEITFEAYYFKTFSSSSLESRDYIVIYSGLLKGFNGYAYSGTSIYIDFDEGIIGIPPTFEYFDSIYIYDQYYKRVVKTKIENDETENDNRSIYYFNSDFGLLRHDIYSDTVQIVSNVLIRKNIIR